MTVVAGSVANLRVEADLAVADIVPSNYNQETMN